LKGWNGERGLGRVFGKETVKVCSHVRINIKRGCGVGDLRDGFHSLPAVSTVAEVKDSAFGICGENNVLFSVTGAEDWGYGIHR
jgi:hypothetical protein